jgi:3-oxoacyl-[acyl-carrier protein] reductase
MGPGDAVSETLEGRSVLVTGAASGIGLAVARQFAQAGSVVGVNYLPDDPCGPAVVDELKRAGHRVHRVAADVTDEHALGAAVAAFAAEAGDVQVLVSNAGIASHKRFLQLSSADWERMIAVHLFGARNAAFVALPPMLEAGDGVIVFTASELAAVGAVDLTHYCAAKGAIVSFAKSLAREVGDRGVRVNCVAPGPTETDMLTPYPEEYSDANRELLPLKRWGRPDEVARSYLFLAGPGGSWFTGQVISPNGGAVM